MFGTRTGKITGARRFGKDITNTVSQNYNCLKDTSNTICLKDTSNTICLKDTSNLLSQPSQKQPF